MRVDDKLSISFSIADHITTSLPVFASILPMAVPQVPVPKMPILLNTLIPLKFVFISKQPRLISKSLSRLVFKLLIVSYLLELHIGVLLLCEPHSCYNSIAHTQLTPRHSLILQSKHSSMMTFSSPSKPLSLFLTSHSGKMSIFSSRKSAKTSVNQWFLPLIAVV